MGIRVQPKDFEVPDDDPFANDRLDRRQSAEILTHLVGSFEGPCVLAVDAPWGAGKTTFLRMWTRHLQMFNFPVVKFNAWQTDFADDPFLALSEEIVAELKSHKGSIGQQADELKTATLYILRQAAPALVRDFISARLGSAASDVAEKAVASLAEHRLSHYGEAKQAITKFKETLQGVANTLSERRDGQPLVVIIDELDRCRPSYAIKLLETAKHLFAVDRVVFVLAVNRAELAQSVRALYGSGFDSKGYLRRFFDLDFRLPEPNRAAFIDTLLNNIRIDEYLGRTQDEEARTKRGIARQWILEFFGAPEISLRTIEQALHRLGLLLASLRSDKWAFLPMATFVLILRTIDPDLYHRFADGKATDEEVADAMFKRVTAYYRYTHAGGNLECVIVMAASETSLVSNGPQAELDSPLLRKYSTLAQEDKPHDDNADHLKHHAATMIKFIQHEQEKLFRGGRPGFKDSVERLELLSQDLVEETP